MNKVTPPFIHVLLLLVLFIGVVSKSDISTGYRMTLTVPSEYSQGFIGKAFLMESDINEQFPPPNYRTALSVEATNNHDGNQRYSCSLDLYLGTVKVWSSGHHSKFYASEICVLELTQHGDLRLKDSNDQIGWRTGTADQAVQKLKLLESGNMVLVDSLESVKWQTFNFPTDVLVLGQRLSVATHLVSYPAAAAGGNLLFYSLEIQHDKLGLYLNTGNKEKYSYWEFEPSKGRNITFVELTSKGLELFDDAFQKFAQIYATPTTTTPELVRFLALDNSTGNLGLYYYCPLGDKFHASFEALNNTCDLPLACSNNYTICTHTGACSCIVLSTTGTGEGGKADGYLGRASLSHSDSDSDSKCGDEIGSHTGALLALCGGDHIHRDGAEIMVELVAAVTVLRSASSETGKIKTSVDNVSKEECADMCSRDCECMATLYGRQGRRECEFYDVVSGVKLKTDSEPGTYLVKVANPNASTNNNSIKRGFRKWVLLLIVASDGLILLFVAAALAYFFIWKRRRGSSSSNIQ